jgi:hypothetical protein
MMFGRLQLRRGAKVLLVGSAALSLREPRDLDFIATHDEAKAYIDREGFPIVYPNEKGSTLICRGGDKPVELMIAWPGSTNEEILHLESEREAASLNTLYLLKMSHRFLRNSPHFEKTRRDILQMRSLGAVIEHPALLAKREKETYDYKHPSLMRNKKQFFDPNEGVQYVYDHDTIHLAMAVEPMTPAYTNFKHDQAEVMIDRQKWDAQPIAVQLNSVLEESLVLALERSQIPFRGQIDPRRSFRIALQKVCTSISSGWWREFSWENYDRVIELFEQREAEQPYLSRFDAAVEAGVVRPFDGQVRHE